MQKQNPIDDLFRSELADYKVGPSDERRAAFMREAVGKYGKGSWPFWWIAGVVAICLIGVGIAVLVLKDHSPAPARNSSIAAASTSVPSASSTHSAHSIESANKTINTHPTSDISHPPSDISSPPSDISHPTSAISHPPSAISHPASRIPDLSSRTPQPASRIPDLASTAPDSVSRITDPASQTPHPASRIPDPAITHPAIPAAPQEEAPKSSAKPETQNEEKQATFREKSYPPKKWNISAGAYYTPEWMFNTLNGDKFVNNFGVEGTFHFGRYSVRTGLGLSVTTGSNELLRQTNSYLGQYNALDSMTFQWDGDHTSLIPTYYTKQQNVYDTAVSYNYSYNKKRYTYLQVPLILGYDFLQNNWFSMGIRGGAVMSLLVKSETLNDTYNNSEDKVITINNVSPDRIQLNWQGIGGINATFRLSRRFSFEIEPEVRYYFNSVYESSEITTKPWSLGVRAAFIITW